MCEWKNEIFYFAVVCIIGVMLFSYLACQRSCCHYKKLCCKKRKRSQGLLESTISSEASLDHLSGLASSNASSQASSGLRKSRRVGDLNHSLNLNNSWMEKKGNPSGFEESFNKSRLLTTASKLGRKLIAMDKESDKVQAAKRGSKAAKKSGKPLGTKSEQPEENQWKF